MTAALQNAWNAIFSSWLGDKNVNAPSISCSTSIASFGCKFHGIEDFASDIERYMQRKIKICDKHTTLAYEPTSKADARSCMPTALDGDNLALKRCKC